MADNVVDLKAPHFLTSNSKLVWREHELTMSLQVRFYERSASE